MSQNQAAVLLYQQKPMAAKLSMDDAWLFYDTCYLWELLSVALGLLWIPNPKGAYPLGIPIPRVPYFRIAEALPRLYFNWFLLFVLLICNTEKERSPIYYFSTEMQKPEVGLAEARSPRFYPGFS